MNDIEVGWTKETLDGEDCWRFTAPDGEIRARVHGRRGHWNASIRMVGSWQNIDREYFLLGIAKVVAVMALGYRSA